MSNGPIGKQVYDKVDKLEGKIERWHDEDAKRWEAVAGTLGRMDATVAANDKRIEATETAIVRLQDSDKRYGIFASVAASIVGAVSGILTGRN